MYGRPEIARDRCSHGFRARRADILKLFSQKGVVLAGLGIMAGVTFAPSTTSLMASFLRCSAA